MADSIDFDQLLSSSQGGAAALAFTDPKSLLRGKPAAATAWRLLSGSIALRRAGRSSEANDWFNTSLSAQREPGAVLRAEQVAEAGLGLFGDKRWEDAARILQGAGAQWIELCQTAVDGDAAKIAELAREVAEMLDALGAGVPAARAKGAQAATLVRKWLEDRAVLRRAEVLGTYAQLLGKSGQHEDARKVYREASAWIQDHLTEPKSMKAVPNRRMSAITRRALYQLLLARGEVELAADEYQASADGFGAAVKLYDGHVVDATDVSRMIRAHVNQANSLLRLGRYDEAIGIYELAQMGFRSIGDEASAARVEQAKLFAKMKKAEAGGS